MSTMILYPNDESTQTENMGEPKKKIYLDYNATTPLAPEVINGIYNSMLNSWGNPSSNHEEGAIAKKAIEDARAKVANMISAKTSDIVFLSGGTEANNLVIYSSVVHFRKFLLNKVNPVQKDQKPHVITTLVEHDSITLPLKLRYFIETDITYIGVDNLVMNVMSNIRPTTCLISVMYANNETGIVYSLTQIAKELNELNKRRVNEGLFKIFLHSDAAQAIGKIPVDAAELNVDYLTVVGHKFYGPRIGALYCKDIRVKTPLYPLIYGGSQENGLRAGTENTPMIVGLGIASELVTQNLHLYATTMKKHRIYLERQLKKVFGKFVKMNCLEPCRVNDPETCCIPPTGPKQTTFVFPRLPNTTSISFYYQEITGFQILENCRLLQASTGAACHSKSDGQNSSLEASGVCSFHAARTVRLSLGRDTNMADIDNIISDLRQAIERVNEQADPLA